MQHFYCVNKSKKKKSLQIILRKIKAIPILVSICSMAHIKGNFGDRSEQGFYSKAMYCRDKQDGSKNTPVMATKSKQMEWLLWW